MANASERLSKKKRPNILLITADEMRHDCFGAAGHPLVRTPNLDALARRGVRFTNAYTPFPVCVPARMSIMTGQYARAHGLISNRGFLAKDQATLPRSLSEAGYRTAAIGKMHFWPPYNGYGFQSMCLAEQHGQGYKIDDYHSEYLAQRGLVDMWDLWDQQRAYRANAPREYWESFGARASELPEEHYHTTWIADRTIDCLNEDDDRPFFIWTSFIKPHHPFDPPKPWDEMYNPADVPAPHDQAHALAKPLMTQGGRKDPREAFFDLTQMSEEAYRRVAALYYATISHIDHHVGRILKTLEELGKIDDTLVIFTSDHGDYMGAYGLILKHPNVPYDALAKVPMVVAGPGVSEGVVSDDLVSLIDLFPTAAALAGSELPRSVQGRDLSDLLSGKRQEGKAFRDAIFVESGGIKAVRTDRYKYLYDHSNGLEELYDLSEDPDELHDLAAVPEERGRVGEVVREMRDLLLGWLIETESDRHTTEWRFDNLMPQ